MRLENALAAIREACSDIPEIVMAAEQILQARRRGEPLPLGALALVRCPSYRWNTARPTEQRWHLKYEPIEDEV